jgi:hypothetical protein
LTESELAKLLISNPDLGIAGAANDHVSASVARVAQSQRLSEHAMQAAIIAEADARAVTVPEWGLLYAVPNGGYRGKAQGGKLKAEGVRAGMPDLHLPVARHSRIGLWLELKAGNNKPSGLQMERIRLLRVEGHCVEVVWDDPQEAIKILEWWIEG